MLQGYHPDGDEKLLCCTELVIASMHGGGIMKEGSVDDITRAWMAIAADERIDVIGHPGSPAFLFDYEPVIREFGRRKKVVEINENSFNAREGSLENCTRIAYFCKKYGVRIVINSDAHFHEYVGRFDRSIVMLEQLDFPPELIINGSRDNLETYFKEKHISI